MLSCEQGLRQVFWLKLHSLILDLFGVCVNVSADLIGFISCYHHARVPVPLSNPTVDSLTKLKTRSHYFFFLFTALVIGGCLYLDPKRPSSSISSPGFAASPTTQQPQNARGLNVDFDSVFGNNTNANNLDGSGRTPPAHGHFFPPTGILL